jgi:ketosteroid isomerase-like protein
MIRCYSGVIAAVLVTVFVTGQERVLSELQALVDAERAFAKAATVKGVRDSFLEFFADDSIALRPAPVPAKDRLRSQTPQPFSAHELTWEPRTGDIAGSGELGWLTGPSTFIDHTAKDSKPGYGNYLSVWRKQADGTWKVFIDVGATTPQLVDFAPGFVRFPLEPRYSAKEGKATATATMLDADRGVNTRMAEGTVSAYTDRLTSASRLHRPGFVTIVGPSPIRDWLAANAAAMSATTTTGESATSGDLGYTYGTFEVKGSTAQGGAYVRVWTRDARGKWWIAADVTQPVRP